MGGFIGTYHGGELQGTIRCYGGGFEQVWESRQLACGRDVGSKIQRRCRQHPGKDRGSEVGLAGKLVWPVWCGQGGDKGWEVTWLWRGQVVTVRAVQALEPNELDF